ncbi:hypothetical protein [Desulfosarcina sp.]|uniref:hypothetical protein n=1 Tax=Desulfosarcina sp. TaxID=2027861 RepID=UPI003970D570
MKKIALALTVLFFACPMDLQAFRDHPPAVKPLGSGPATYPLSPQMRARLKMPVQLPVDSVRPGKPGQPIYRGSPPGRRGHGRPAYWWPAGTTQVQEPQPIIIVNTPPPASPTSPPEPQRTWVPPVMDTRTEPGYWDYGIRKVWMGDHWRYEQDQDEKTWVPASTVEYVKQAGYWKIFE